MTRNRILFITNAELGQANVQLAVIQELLAKTDDYDLHLASFGGLSQAIESLNQTTTPQRAVTFHELKGPTWKEALFERPEHKWKETCALAPTWRNASRLAPMMTRIVAPWSRDELVDLVLQTEKVVKDVDASLVIVDNLFTPAITVCYNLNPKWSVLSPNSYREFLLGYQTEFERMYQHPPCASLLPYPVPFYLRPAAWYIQKQYMKLVKDEWVIGHAMNMQEKINKPYSDWGRVSYDPPKGLKIILPSNSHNDFPFSVVPDHIVSCGPIVRVAKPVEETDPDLAAWLKRRPTVFINLGSHVIYDKDATSELTAAVHSLLDEAKKAKQEIQVLWKMNKSAGGHEGGQKSAVSSAMNGHAENDRIRIVDWLETEPISILRSENVICSVNHGGANSYFEAISAGVAQVVLPVWFDTYDFARRVDYLGIGKIGNRQHAPSLSKDELAPVLRQVVLGREAERIRERAAVIAKACQAGGEGREIATQAILELLADGE
ncbi:unnamed protein product [Clonostachys byssicola]|uniref:Erythromycin biosynthesis protein CIII-like C-terminal domain-containing protein n=1 Tax=Clonostachys byssicola TaxID=160290 RepID=A0A9N9Y613_9HYPO|nr:unnamed protein product [Clonostachys byssicola]